MIMDLIELINTYFSEFKDFMVKNPIIAGVFSMWGLSVITFMFVNIPRRVFNFLKEQFTTTLIVNNSEEFYRDALMWITNNGVNSFTRHFTVETVWVDDESSNEDFNEDGLLEDGSYHDVLSVGYGRAYMFCSGVPTIMERSKDSNPTLNTKNREFITLTIPGRSRKRMEKIVNFIKDSKKKSEKNTLNVYVNDSFGNLSQREVSKRKFETISLNEGVAERIMKIANDFRPMEKWYKEKGIPYKEGIVLEGPPGTGKTSIIKGLASEMNRDLYLLNLNGLTDSAIESVLSDVRKNSIVAIEDIDSFSASKKRIKDSGEEKDEEVKTLSTSGLLNALDGITSPEGIFIIATTNHISSLDPALIRSGRLGNIINIGFMDKYAVTNYLKMFFDGEFTLPEIKDDIRPCDMQQKVISGASLDQMIQYVKKDDK